MLTVIHTIDQTLMPGNKPDWCQMPSAGYFRMSKEGGTPDCHCDDYNEFYLVCRGKAKLLNGGKEYYVKAGAGGCLSLPADGIPRITSMGAHPGALEHPVSTGIAK